MDLYAAYAQIMALLQLVWIKYTVGRYWYSQDQWTDWLVSSLSNPTVDTVWAPVLLQASTDLHQMSPLEIASAIVDYAVGEVNIRLLGVRVSSWIMRRG